MPCGWLPTFSQKRPFQNKTCELQSSVFIVGIGAYRRVGGTETVSEARDLFRDYFRSPGVHISHSPIQLSLHVFIPTLVFVDGSVWNH